MLKISVWKNRVVRTRVPLLFYNGHQQTPLKGISKKYPLGREMIPTNKQATIQVETLTVHKQSFLKLPSVNTQVTKGGVMEFSNEDTIMSNKPTYIGEAEIKPEIIEPRRLDLPTTVYKNGTGGN